MRIRNKWKNNIKRYISKKRKKDKLLSKNFDDINEFEK